MTNEQNSPAVAGPVERRVRTRRLNMELVLIRGLPGSGKSTMASAMTTHRHLEADMFFTDLNGAYLYDASKIKAAHEWCQTNAKWALDRGESVVVSNTFTRRFEMEPYFEIAKAFGIELRIIEATGNWPNVHGVPTEVVEKMRKRWEKSSNAVLSGKPPRTEL